MDYFQAARLVGFADVRYEVDERSLAEDGRSAAASRAWCDDYQPFYGDAYWYAGDGLSAILYGYDGDDRLVCECRTADAGSGHLRHHGCQHWYDAHGMDHVGRYVVRHHQCRLSGFLPGHHPDLSEEVPLHRRLPLRSVVPAFRIGHAARHWHGDALR